MFQVYIWIIIQFQIKWRHLFRRLLLAWLRGCQKVCLNILPTKFVGRILWFKKYHQPVLLSDQSQCERCLSKALMFWMYRKVKTQMEPGMMQDRVAVVVWSKIIWNVQIQFTAHCIKIVWFLDILFIWFQEFLLKCSNRWYQFENIFFDGIFINFSRNLALVKW